MLSRADSFGEGALGQRNPIEHAHAHSQKLAQRLAQSVATVVPVAGLLAESSHTGQVTEADAIALHTLASMNTLELMDVLESETPERLGPVMRDRLLDLLGEYGVLGARTVAGQGAHAVNQWLTEHSGITQVKYLLESALQDFAALHRADRILTELDLLAVNHPAREHIRTITDWVRNDPAMHPVLLYRALRGMLLADPHAPVVNELTRLLSGRPTPNGSVCTPRPAPGSLPTTPGNDWFTFSGRRFPRAPPQRTQLWRNWFARTRACGGRHEHTTRQPTPGARVGSGSRLRNLQYCCRAHRNPLRSTGNSAPDAPGNLMSSAVFVESPTAIDVGDVA